MTISAIAFDWGGIFTEGTFDASAVRNLAARTHTAEADIAKVYFPLMEHFEAGAFDFETFTARFLGETGVSLRAEEFQATFLGSVRDRQKMYDVLKSIPERYTVGILSNNVPVLCDQVRDDPRLARVEHFVFSNELEVRKPDPRAFAALSAVLGHPPEETVFVDDNPDNIAACEALGYKGLLLTSYDGFAAGWQNLLPDLPLP